MSDRILCIPPACRKQKKRFIKAFQKYFFSRSLYLPHYLFSTILFGMAGLARPHSESLIALVVFVLIISCPKEDFWAKKLGRSVHFSWKTHRRESESCAQGSSRFGGLGGMPPPNSFFNFRGSEMPFPTFSREQFQ